MYASHSPLGFQWSGCSDNLSYGVAFSQTFVDEPERAKGTSSGRPLMNIHNNEAGRKASEMFRLLILKLVNCILFSWFCLSLFRRSYITCRLSVSVMVFRGPVSSELAGRSCLRSAGSVLCWKNALMGPQRYVTMALFQNLLSCLANYSLHLDGRTLTEMEPTS